jgi:probable HAF family extracellular repeat protein
MKPKTWKCTAAMTLLAALAIPLQFAAQQQPEHHRQRNYHVVTYGTLGGTSSAANAINDRGWVMGSANLADDTTMHATAWIRGRMLDLGTLGGPDRNSSVPWAGVRNNDGFIVGVSETDDLDPYGEFWSCALAFFNTITGHTCKAFVWRDGSMTALPTLGGRNGVATGNNHWGQAVGWAETSLPDSTCNLPQVFQFKAAVYDLRRRKTRPLEPLPGDPDSAATAINDWSQVVGISGLCSNAIGGLSAQHAVLWEHGVPTEIPNLGGKAWNTPTAINNRGQVVGFSDLPNDDPAHPNYHAFLWTKEGGIKDLGVLPGDTRSIAWGINDRGQVVGQSTHPGSRRAFIYENGVMTELQTLMPPGSPLLQYANDINNRGEIVGGAFDPSTNEAPAFKAIPQDDDDSAHK